MSVASSAGFSPKRARARPKRGTMVAIAARAETSVRSDAPGRRRLAEHPGDGRLGQRDASGVKRVLVGAADDVAPRPMMEFARDPDELQAVLRRDKRPADPEDLQAQHQARDRDEGAAGHRADSSVSIAQRRAILRPAGRMIGIGQGLSTATAPRIGPKVGDALFEADLGPPTDLGANPRDIGPRVGRARRPRPVDFDPDGPSGQPDQEVEALADRAGDSPPVPT